MSLKIKVVGPFSGQVGGVASYIKRLVNGRNIDEVYDPYTGIHYLKKNDGTYEKSSKYSSFFRYLFLIFYCMYSKNELVFMNFSTINSVVLELLMGRSKNRRYIFHNGKPTKARFTLLYRFIFRIKRLKVVSLTEQQMADFYDLFGYITCRDVVYIPPFIGFELPYKDKDILIAGYAKSLYNIDNFLSLVGDNLEKFKDMQISVVLYGEPDVDVYERIIASCDSLICVDLYEEMPEEDFLYLLSRHKVYFRPTTIDSFGFSIKDALELGCISYCSSVIPRPSGSYIFDLPIDDHTLNELLCFVALEKDAIKVTTSDDLISFNTISYL